MLHGDEIRPSGEHHKHEDEWLLRCDELLDEMEPRYPHHEESSLKVDTRKTGPHIGAG